MSERQAIRFDTWSPKCAVERSNNNTNSQRQVASFQCQVSPAWTSLLFARWFVEGSIPFILAFVDCFSFKVCATSDWLSSGERTIAQYGPPARIFERPFAIVYGTKSQYSSALLKLAVQIANDWFLYSGGNSMFCPTWHYVLTYYYCQPQSIVIMRWTPIWFLSLA